MTTLTIGAVARAASVSVDTIRYYERTGLLAAPARSRSGYRKYQPDAVTTVRFIKHTQRLGFTLAEIGDLLTLRMTTVPCDAVRDRASAKMQEIEEKVASLIAMQAELGTLIARCETDCPTTCSVLNGLGAPTAPSDGVSVDPARGARRDNDHGNLMENNVATEEVATAGA